MIWTAIETVSHALGNPEKGTIKLLVWDLQHFETLFEWKYHRLRPIEDVSQMLHSDDILWVGLTWDTWAGRTSCWCPDRSPHQISLSAVSVAPIRRPTRPGHG
jgi:hypothetical protein